MANSNSCSHAVVAIQCSCYVLPTNKSWCRDLHRLPKQGDHCGEQWAALRSVYTSLRKVFTHHNRCTVPLLVMDTLWAKHYHVQALSPHKGMARKYYYMLAGSDYSLVARLPASSSALCNHQKSREAWERGYTVKLECQYSKDLCYVTCKPFKKDIRKNDWGFCLLHACAWVYVLLQL